MLLLIAIILRSHGRVGTQAIWRPERYHGPMYRLSMLSQAQPSIAKYQAGFHQRVSIDDCFYHGCLPFTAPSCYALIGCTGLVLQDE